LYVGSVQPPHTRGNVRSATRLALSGRYLLQTEALIGLIDRQTTSRVPDASSLGLNISTARGHLKKFFEQTDTHRQIDLVKIALQAAKRNELS
jgi:hypothetical protein